MLQSTAAVSALTLLSRVLGFVRDMLIARWFGADLATDAFFVAFKLPNFLRRLFTEGAFAQAFIPVLAELQVRGDPVVTGRFLGQAAAFWAVLLAVLTLLGMVAAPLLIWLLAPGFAWQGAQHELAAQMLQITLPYLFFIGLVAFAGSILNACQKFLIPALTPALLNLGMIGAAIWLAPWCREPVTALAWGVSLAGFGQLLLQLAALQRLGMLPKLHWGRPLPSVQRLFRRIAPAIVSVSVTQINLLLDTLIASFLTVGSVSWLYYSDRLVEFPQGLLGLALGTALLPQLAKHHAQTEPQGFAQALDFGLKLALLVGIPATLGLIALAEPMLAALFQYNAFTADDVRQAARSLIAYALGLPGFLLIKVLVPGFTARHDLATPLRYGLYALAASFLGNVLAIPFAHAGLALATSLGATLNALLLLAKLRQERIYQPGSGWWLFLVRLVFACVVMMACLRYWPGLDAWAGQTASVRIGRLLLSISAGVASFAFALLVVGFRPRHLLMAHDKMPAFFKSNNS